MLEKALTGGKRYWSWIFFLLAVVGTGIFFYVRQFNGGLGLTGMGRDVSWGVYVSQFTFLVGISASTIIVIMSYYLHNHKVFGRIAVLGEFLSIASIIMCILFLFINLGQPTRVLNVMIHPTPNSVMFWGMVLLFGYLLLNIVIGWTTLSSEYRGDPIPGWIKPFIYLSIPWAFAIFTAIAFLYASLLVRHFWLSAFMVARFSAAAFASGIALLIILCLILRKITTFDPGKEAVQGMSKIVTYAMIANIFFLGLQLFTAFYSNIPEHMLSFKYLYIGIEGNAKLVPLMWISGFLALVSLPLLLIPGLRKNETSLVFACLAVYVSIWLDMGLGLVVSGFVPNPFDRVMEYWPTIPESLISTGVWAMGAIILTGLYKIILSVKESVQD